MPVTAFKAPVKVPSEMLIFTRLSPFTPAITAVPVLVKVPPVMSTASFPAVSGLPSGFATERGTFPVKVPPVIFNEIGCLVVCWATAITAPVVDVPLLLESTLYPAVLSSVKVPPLISILPERNSTVESPLL